MGMAISQTVIDAFVETYGRTRHLGASAAAVGVSQEWVFKRKREDPEFAERLDRAAMRLDGMVQERAIKVVLDGAPREVINMLTGDVITLRSYCRATTIEYLKKFCGWGEEANTDTIPRKEVFLMEAPGKPAGLLGVMRAQVAEAKGIEIEAPAGDVVEEEA